MKDAQPVAWYVAAGGVVVRDRQVLVLRRPSRGEVRLPKGHVELGESIETAAVREVLEESGHSASIKSDLGVQVVEFDRGERHWVRTERYFLMELTNPGVTTVGEAQFESMWVDWADALRLLTFEAEREWVRRAYTEAIR